MQRARGLLRRAWNAGGLEACGRVITRVTLLAASAALAAAVVCAASAGAATLR